MEYSRPVKGYSRIGHSIASTVSSWPKRSQSPVRLKGVEKSFYLLRKEQQSLTADAGWNGGRVMAVCANTVCHGADGLRNRCARSCPDLGLSDSTRPNFLIFIGYLVFIYTLLYLLNKYI